jgi:hypothetical protein
LASPIQALLVVVFQQSGLPQLMKHTDLHPFLKPVMSRAAGTEAGGIQCVPLAAGSQDEPNRVHALAVIGTRATTAKAMRVHVLGQQGLNLGPQFVRDLVRFFRIHP